MLWLAFVGVAWCLDLLPEAQIVDFQFLGPFIMGKTEIDSDPVRSASHNCSLDQILSREPYCPTRFPSEVAIGGYATWMPFPKEGLLPVLARAHQAQIVHSLNKLTALEFSGWAVAKVVVSDPGIHRIQCQPAHTIYIDGHRYEEVLFFPSAVGACVGRDVDLHMCERVLCIYCVFGVCVCVCVRERYYHVSSIFFSPFLGCLRPGVGDNRNESLGGGPQALDSRARSAHIQRRLPSGVHWWQLHSHWTHWPRDGHRSWQVTIGEHELRDVQLPKPESREAARDIS